MMNSSCSRWLCSAVAAAFILLSGAVGPAQEVEELGGPLNLDKLFDGADIGSGLLSEPDPRVSSSLQVDGEKVVLSVRLELPEGGNTYSQDPAFSKPTRISVHKAVGLSPVSDGFVPDHEPKRAFDENFQREVEKHFGVVTWTREYRLLSGANPSRLAITGAINFLYCQESCRLLELPFEATVAATRSASGGLGSSAPASAGGVDDLSPPPVEELGGPPDTTDTTGSSLRSAYRTVPQYPLSAHANGDPAVAEFRLDEQPGSDEVVLAVTLQLGPRYHVYALKRAPNQTAVPTVLEIKNVRGLDAISKGFAPLTDPAAHEQDLGFEVSRYLSHEGTVTWTRTYRKKPGTEPGVSGVMTFQICNDQVCLMPKTVEFSLGSLQDPQDVQSAEPVSASLAAADRRTALSADSEGGGKTAAANEPATDAVAQITFEDENAGNTLITWLVSAFLGGLILNVMPCVLPVISIKILSFVHQAGEKPGRVLLLNVVYALGVMSVFIALAILAMALKLHWGDQNQSATYNIVMTAIVFAMGLSLLGVFEIPIPGMFGSGVGGHHQEGLPGAFLTGIIATLLATPCTGPFMGAAVSWSLKQPNHIILAVFGLMGLGMASPYLVIGCFPRLIDWLPRPGQWMVTFKQVCGFVLMGTSVWILNTLQGIHAELVIPTLVILVGISLFVWMIGQLYDLSSSARRRWGIRAAAVLLAGPIILLGGRWAHSVVTPPTVVDVKLPWEPFSHRRFEELLLAGEPVLIDFTADYCLICKANERLALNTPATAEFVKEHGFVTLMADFTQADPEIRHWLDYFKNDGVPLTVIVPPGNPSKTRVLRSAYLEDRLLKELQEAVNDGRPHSAEATAAYPSDKTVSMKQ